MFKRFGRTVINTSLVVKVVLDGKRKVAVVNFQNGSKAEYKKHADAVWAYFKGAAR